MHPEASLDLYLVRGSGHYKAKGRGIYVRYVASAPSLRVRGKHARTHTRTHDEACRATDRSKIRAQQEKTTEKNEKQTHPQQAKKKKEEKKKKAHARAGKKKEKKEEETNEKKKTIFLNTVIISMF